MADLRELSLWEMLVWVYRDQKAHLYLKRPMDWLLWSIAFHEIVEDTPRAAVHPDAAQLHAAVCGLPEKQATMLVSFACEQQQPQPPSSFPMAFSTRVDYVDGLGLGERIAQGEFQGREIQYLVRWHESVRVWEYTYKRFGKKHKRVSSRSVKHRVEFCPVDWRPGLAWVIAIAKIHSDWLYAMQALAHALEDQTFRDHALSGSGIENSEAVDWQELMEWQRLQERIGMRGPEVDLDLSRDKITTQDAETFYRRNARATHV